MFEIRHSRLTIVSFLNVAAELLSSYHRQPCLQCQQLQRTADIGHLFVSRKSCASRSNQTQVIDTQKFASSTELVGDIVFGESSI